jgi:uncharacterized protein (TIGR02271 family)
MASTIVGLFNTYSEAQDAVQELTENGIKASDISVIANDAHGQFKSMRAGDSAPGDFDTPDDTGGTKGAEGATTGAVGGGLVGGALGLLAGLGALAIPGIGPVLAAGPLVAALGSAGAGAVAGAGIGAAGGGLIGGLVGMGIPDEDANAYAEGVRRGGTLVTVQTRQDMADRAAAIMSRHGAVDIDDRSAEWRKNNWSRFDTKAKPYSAQEIDKFRSSAATTTTATNMRDRSGKQGERVVPVIEEELQVGKRQVQGGGVRVHTTVKERPVEEKVELHQERVNVERRPVDRPVDAANADMFREQSFEVTERSEEPVVQKRARVVEEVVINKQVQDRTETVRDTVRRQDVHVDQQSAQRAVGSAGYDTYDADFRSNFQKTIGDRGYTYEQYAPVYRYGYTLATDQSSRNRNWADLEADARTRWEERNPNTWDEFKDSIRYAWERARSKV